MRRIYIMKELIERVKIYKELYDPNHPDYMKTDVKHQIWEIIANAVGLKDGIEAKDAWLKLRNCHRDAIRRQNRYKSKNGDCDELKQWRHQQQMSFLIPYMNIRDSNRSQTDNDNETQTEIELHEDGPLFHKHFIQETSLEIEEEPDEKRVKLEETNEETNMQLFVKQYLERREERSHQRAIERELMNERFKKDDDPLYHFFMSMYISTSKMPGKLQHVIKKNIFQLISDTEEKLLDE